MLFIVLGFGIILCCRVIQSCFQRKSSNLLTNTSQTFLYSSYYNAISIVFSLIVMAFTGGFSAFNAYAFLLAIIAGVSLVMCSVCALYAIKCSTIVLTSMMSTFGMVIPCIVGIFVFGERLSIFQWLGMLIFFAGAFFLCSASKKIFNGFSLKALLLLLGCFLFDGAVMTMQTIFTRFSDSKMFVGNSATFSFIMFLTASISALVVFGFTRINKKKKSGNFKLQKMSYLYGAILALAVFGISFIVTKLAYLPPVVIFPIVNGGAALISFVVGAVVFKEKITVKSALGFILSLGALFVINFL